MPRGGRLVSDAVERARHALADYEAACAARAGEYGAARACAEALYRLMGEIGAGVWLDTRELATLGSVDLAINNARSGARAPLWVVTRFSEPGGSWVALTAVDAVRAAREAADA